MNRPLLIGIGAAHSGAGKTTLAVHILRHLSRRSAGAPHLLRCGAIKYTRTFSAPEVVCEIPVLMTEGKDTCRLRDAGAEEVVWIRSARSGLAEALPAAFSRLSRQDVIIIEGNSAIEFLNPDIVIFIFDRGRVHWKPGIEKLAARANIIFADEDVQVPADIQPQERFPGDFSFDGLKGFFDTLSRMVDERRVETRDAEKGG